MNIFSEKISLLSGFLAGPYALIPLLFFTGLFLTIRLRGLQVRALAHSLYLGLIVRKEHGAEGDISHFQALMTALAATVGTGNIVGVATAISMGGPGALFWMWVTGFLGMATKYGEALLAVKFREKNSNGEQAGGPMYYLSKGVGGRAGRLLGCLFAIFAAFATFGIGCMVQSHSVADAVQSSFGITPWISGAIMTVAAGVVLLGGIRSIGAFSGLLVPFMLGLYIICTAVVILINVENLPEVFILIFTSAFNGNAAAGGFIGATVAQALRFGVARGIFSNEAGMGSGGIAAAAAQTKDPVTQALVQMTQTFIDTIIVCSMTGLAILSSGVWQSGENGVRLTQLAFETSLPGEWGGVVVALSLTLFAFSTLLGWSYYGERSVEYLFGTKVTYPYRVFFVCAIFIGTLYSLEAVWAFSDLTNALMAFPNLIGLIVLSPIIVRETKVFFKGLS